MTEFDNHKSHNSKSDRGLSADFQSPPAGYGNVPFFWWLGDPLTKERLSWILEQMVGMKISCYQINYAHSDKKGKTFGLSFPSEPKLFSQSWWELVEWFMGRAKEQGASISLSDYTLGAGQGWAIDEILNENQDINGMQLKVVTGEVPVGAIMSTTVTDTDGKIQQVAVVGETIPLSLNPMHPKSGPEYVKRFFGKFDKRFPGECGKGLNFFFSDELDFRIRGNIWSANFADEFRKRKGYDIVPVLHALFMDIGPRTPKIRMDYSDVKVSLTEEGFFIPVYEWHQKRGMTMGCDHGGRGTDVTEFGDYFRTQRWNQGPGSDQPHLAKNLIRAKIAASIAHMYERPRVWLEGFYGSGWGTTSAEIADATFANFVLGYNLLSFHGMYYSTQGGWWEWAPPDNTFRMPYWRSIKGFMACVERLSYLLSQGVHRCDVAIIYPVAPMEAGMDGQKSVDTAFSVADTLYKNSIDFDFMDFQSLDRAKVVGNELYVSGEVFKVLILPAMKAIRHSNLKKALEFKRAGGIVLAIDALPEASDRMGRDDPEVASIVSELFPDGADKADSFLKAVPERDYNGPGMVQHRKIGERDLYAVYDAPEGAVAEFRATGKVELWNPWTGETRPLHVISQKSATTKLHLPLTEKEIQLIFFSPGEAEIEKDLKLENRKSRIEIAGNWEFEMAPTCDNRFGDFLWPPSPDKIGAEIRQLWYCEGDKPDGNWRKVTCTFGPQFISCEKLPDGNSADGSRVEFSWRYGIENDPGHQGYHGLKGYIHNDIFSFGRLKDVWDGSNEVCYEDDGKYPFLWTTVNASADMTAYVITGAMKPAGVWLNGKAVSGNVLNLKPGSNSIVLKYNEPGRAYFVLSKSDRQEIQSVEPDVLPSGQLEFKQSSLASHWWKNEDVIPFDVRPQEKNPVGWYRFTSPPGFKAMDMDARGKIQAWADGNPMTGKAGTFTVPEISPVPVTVLIRIEQESGFYGGSAFNEPIKLHCENGSIALGDWSQIDGLLSYSGGAWYRKKTQIPASKKVLLDLGDLVSSAEVWINGKTAGTLILPPWQLDISKFVKPGENLVEVLVFNTLANHYTTIPTRYRGSTVSGLLGPVCLLLST